MLFRSSVTLALTFVAFVARIQALHDTSHDSRPNILLLLTDDQDTVLGGTEHMPRLQRFMTEQGTTFSNCFVHTPICCPSRGSILTGRYLHNIAMTNNSISGNCYGKDWQQNAERETFAVYARKAGYQTAFAGKYLNQYGRRQQNQLREHNGCVSGNERVCRRVPPGWDRWMGLVGNSVYYDYDVVVSDNAGAEPYAKSHGMSYKKDYLPEVVARQTMKTIREFSGQDDPFMIMVAWPTPHGPFTPAPRDKGKFAGFQAPRTPNWNSTDAQNAEKHWLVRKQLALTDTLASHIDAVYQSRQESLQTIDRHVAQFVKELERQGKLENTVIIYTSDNGYQLGQHRLPADKRQLYEHDIRVPMIVRGPGIPKNAIINDIVLNIDIAPTIVGLVKQSSSSAVAMDGQSFMPLLLNHNSTFDSHSYWRSDFLVSYHGEGDPTSGMYGRSQRAKQNSHPGDSSNNTYHCVRSMKKPESGGSSATGANSASNTMYCQFDDDESFVEYYDLVTDPWQLHNSASHLSDADRWELEMRLIELKACKGRTCRESFAP